MSNVYLVIQAHAGTANLETLLRTFDIPGFAVGVHIDEKTDIEPFAEIVNGFPRAELLQPRLNNNRAAWEILQVHINALKHCRFREDISHVVFISGDSTPLKAPLEILSFFRNLPGKSVVHANPWLPNGRPNRHSHSYFKPIQRFLILRNWERMWYWSARLFPRPESKYRRFPKDWQIWFGRGWYGIATEHIKGIVDYCDGEKSMGARFFKGTLFPEEHTFQTFIFNSVPREQIEKKQIMYAEYSLPRPPVLTQKKLAELAQEGEFLFARKIPLVEKNKKRLG